MPGDEEQPDERAPLGTGTRRPEATPSPTEESSAPGSSLDPSLAARMRWGPTGLVPAIVQQYDTGEVLMLAWMDAEALGRTLATRRGTYWSRSREEYWVKGATSGNVQHVREVHLDCDGDTVLVTVDQHGPACHTGSRTCFGEDLLASTSRTDGDG